MSISMRQHLENPQNKQLSFLTKYRGTGTLFLEHESAAEFLFVVKGRKVLEDILKPSQHKTLSAFGKSQELNCVF